MKYDFIVVGSGLYGSVFANRVKAAGLRCLVLEKRPHVGGNIYTEPIEGIEVHKYGAHIFHTSNKHVWNFMNRFAAFNSYRNCPLANYKGEIYNLPFNMNTFYRLWGVITPEQAKEKIQQQRAQVFTQTPENLEQQALNLVGSEIYEKLICGYTQKQWGRPCSQLPPFIIKRLPLRFTYNNNYFDDDYQGIPEKGYTNLIQALLGNIPVKCNTDYIKQAINWNKQAHCVVFTGAIDAFFKYQLGTLEYRSLQFETEVLDCEDYQGNAVVNYTDEETPYTRIIEHKHFAFNTAPKTVVSKEYSVAWQKGMEPYYPINNVQNNTLYGQYHNLGKQTPGVVFGGRLGTYTYLNMDQVVEQALAQTTPQNLKTLLQRAAANKQEGENDTHSNC